MKPTPNPTPILAPVSRSLAGLVEDLAVVDRAIAIEDVSLDSRKVRPGGLFLACRGRTLHAISRAGEAVARGARAILWEPSPGVRAPGDLAAGTFIAAVPNLSRHAGAIADRFFGAPSAALWVAGITGTNGKTTSAWLLAQALNALRRRCGYLGTLGHGFPEALVSGEHTTADAVSVHRELATLRDAGAVCAAMEVSSHALDQHRVGGVRFRVAAFTNLTRDHLDYHGTMEVYGAAKARLFQWPGLASRVINVDDAFGAGLASREPIGPGLITVCRQSSGRAHSQTHAGQGAGYVRAVAVPRTTDRGLALQIETHQGEGDLVVPLIGDFNADNAMLVLGLLIALDVPLAQGLAALSQCAAPSGRMEAIGGGDAPLAIVDYAHTPDALAKALRAARAHCRGRLHLVFGCGGDRDQGKRPIMGRIAAELADRIVLTDDNPRTELAAQIVADIAAGLTATAPVQVTHDRATAIRMTLRDALPGDVVLVAGKGHEQYQIVGTARLPFSDQRVIRESLGCAVSSEVAPCNAR